MGRGGGVGRVLSRLRLLVIFTVAMAVALAATPAHPGAAVLDTEEQALLAFINQYRVANGLTPLSLNSKLNEAALWMSQDMAAKDYISHTDSLGRDAAQRWVDFGYTYNTWKGENLAAGIGTGREAFEMWKDSPGHNANMLNANFKVIGIARAYGEGTTHGWYWTTHFGGQEAPPLAAALAPEPAPEPTPEPTPVRPPEPAPQVAPEQRLEPAQHLIQQEIALWVRSWWGHLTLLGADGPVLRTVSYMAERYLALRTGVFDPRTTSGSQPTYTKD